MRARSDYANVTGLFSPAGRLLEVPPEAVLAAAVLPVLERHHRARAFQGLQEAARRLDAVRSVVDGTY